MSGDPVRPSKTDQLRKALRETLTMIEQESVYQERLPESDTSRQAMAMLNDQREAIIEAIESEPHP